ncbi:hypothetical protein BR93DRAFT_854812, partial [Coniochaeta sp. PMI_546]
SSEEATTYTRLHITPLDPGLLPVVLSGTLLPKARNISYHEIATFPEKRYGFLDLPAEDANKLRKKLNGAVLKGQKIRVEQAKPERIPEPMGDAAMAGDKAPKKKDRKDKKEDKSKKRKREAEEIPGIELENGRKVKRGWTVADDPKSYKDKDKRKKDKKDKKDKKGKREVKSKYTEHPECLIKAVLPSKVVETGEVDEDGNKKRKKHKTKEVVVHEFAKTTNFPTFLKSTVSSSSAKGKGDIEFVDGKGWVDAEGNVVEAVKTRPAPSKAKATTVPAEDDIKPQPKRQEDLMDIVDSPAGSTHSSEAGSDSEEAGDDETESEARKPDIEPAGKDSASVRETSQSPNPISTPTSILKRESARPTSSSSAKGLSIKIPPPPATPGNPTVHPLEALYKRPSQAAGAHTQDAAPESEPFSFFGNGDMEEDTSTVTTQVPLTPFSRQDFESRGIRSAAPTPDTAHPSRMAKFWPLGGADDIEEEVEEDDDEDDNNAGVDVEETGKAADQGADSTSDFQKWFWEHRGDLNRSWKKRRKTAAKEKRYRENRARAERAI